MIACNGLCNGLLVSDTLRPMAPKGYVLLSYSEARTALKIKADADFLSKKMMLRDSLDAKKNSEILALMKALKVNEAKIRRLLFWKNVELWTLRGLLIGLTYKTFE